MAARVVNCRVEPCDVYIGRPSKWGNPYSHKEGTLAEFKVETKEEAISQYRRYLWRLIKSEEVTLKELLSLDGKTLGCFCKPRSCHGDIICQAIEWAKERYGKMD